MRRRIGICLAGAVLLLAMTGCAQEKSETDVLELEESALTKPQKVAVVRGDLRVTASYDAKVGPKVEQLQFADEGTFGEFKVRLGDEVKKGDVLAVPATAELEETIREKEKELESLTVNYEHQKTAFENQLKIASLELENVYEELELLEYGTEQYTAACVQAGIYDQQSRRLKLQAEQLTETYELERQECEKQLRNLQKKCDGNRIRAPFDGVIVALQEVPMKSNDEIPIDTNLYYVAVADSAVLYARCENISTAVLNNAQSVVFWKDGKEYGTTYVPCDETYYKTVNNAGEKAYSQFLLTDSEEEIGFGDYGKIRLIVTEKKDVLMLPNTAIRTSGGEHYVYKDVDGSHERVSVKIGSSDGINVEILEGLEEGDVIYVQE